MVDIFLAANLDYRQPFQILEYKYPFFCISRPIIIGFSCFCVSNYRFCRLRTDWNIPKHHRDKINVPEMTYTYLIDAFYMHFMDDRPTRERFFFN